MVYYWGVTNPNFPAGISCAGAFAGIMGLLVALFALFEKSNNLFAYIGFVLNMAGLLSSYFVYKEIIWFTHQSF